MEKLRGYLSLHSPSPSPSLSPSQHSSRRIGGAGVGSGAGTSSRGPAAASSAAGGGRERRKRAREVETKGEGGRGREREGERGREGERSRRTVAGGLSAVEESEKEQAVRDQKRLGEPQPKQKGEEGEDEVEKWQEGDSASEEGDGAEEGTGEADDRGSEWVSSDYRRQFETEWDASSLDRRMEGLQMATSHQRFGKLRALAEVSHVPADGAPFPPPKLSRAPDESWMGECGVLPPLRSALLKSDAGAKRSCGSMIGPAGRTMLHMLSSYRDLYFPSAALREYDDAPHGGGLMRALALHALQHGLTVTRQR